MTEPKPTLMQSIPSPIYAGIVKDLFQMRRDHPRYRDDQLLIKLLADAREREVVKK